MFKIVKSTNKIEPLASHNFSELGFRERAHLQEWIAHYPSCLGEELLIIQKEFSGFSETSERLDLLALDKDGQLVIIENKLDDTGRDVTWQALKYASYCASLTKDNIRSIYQEYLDKDEVGGNATELLSEFFDEKEFSELELNNGFSQRIILVAANFRKEVTSTVMWLLNFKLQVQCIKVGLVSNGEDLFLNFEQIIPIKDAEDYVIGLANKVQEEFTTSLNKNKRAALLREFWKQVIDSMNEKSKLFENISPGIAHWIGTSSGLSGVGFNFSTGNSFSRAEVYINRPNKDENKFIFDELKKQENILNNAFGGKLVWQRLDHRKASRIKAEIESDVSDNTSWPQTIAFMVDAMQKIDNTFRSPIEKIREEMKTKKE